MRIRLGTRLTRRLQPHGSGPRHHTTMPRRSFLAMVASLALLAPLLTVVETRVGMQDAAAATAVTSLLPNADTYVRSDQPSTNFGSKYVLVAEAPSSTTPEIVSYLRFTVSGLAAPPSKVVLQLFSYSANTLGLQAWAADSTWTESAVTYDTAPVRSSTLAGSVATTSSSAWAAIDLTQAISGNGTYTFAITTPAAGNKQWGSREGGDKPRLEITPADTATAPAPVTTSATAPAPVTTSATVPAPVTTSATLSSGATSSSAPATTATSSSAPPTTATTSPTGATSSASFLMAADTYVASNQPTLNYGTKYNISTEAGSSSTPTIQSYLRVNVAGLTGSVVSASLQLYSYSTTTLPLTAWTTTGSWTETGLTYATAPALGTQLGSDTNIKLNTWTAIDVTAAITGNGTYNLALTTARTAVNNFGSRESTQPPRLVVTTASGSSATGTTTPTTTATPSSSATTPPAVGPTIVAAGDIACAAGKAAASTSCQQMATSNLALSLSPDALLPLGDDQYEYGTLADFQQMYAPSWGRMDSIAHPIPGNHEYGYVGSTIQPTGGEGYFTYFGQRSHPLDPDPACTINCRSWYSYDIGGWHLIALDSQCGVVGGCNPGNAQYQWLLSDLNAHPTQCTLAYWHIPLYASSHDRQPDMQSIYSLLYSKGADVVLTGHAHYYERFAPQNASGVLDPAKGVREFVVGSGGRSFFAIDSPQANSEFRLASTFGVLQMTLGSGNYSWSFRTTTGTTADSGTASCH